MNREPYRHKTIDEMVEEAYWLYDLQCPGITQYEMTPPGVYAPLL